MDFRLSTAFGYVYGAAAWALPGIASRAKLPPGAYLVTRDGETYGKPLYGIVHVIHPRFWKPEFLRRPVSGNLPTL